MAETSLNEEKNQSITALLNLYTDEKISREEYNRKNSAISKASNSVEIQTIIRNQKGNTSIGLLD